MKNDIDNQIVKLNKRAEKGRNLVYYLYKKPYITINEVAQFLKLTRRPAHDIIKEFKKMNILHEFTGLKRNREYFFKNYLNLFEEL